MAGDDDRPPGVAPKVRNEIREPAERVANRFRLETLWCVHEPGSDVIGPPWASRSDDLPARWGHQPAPAANVARITVVSVEDDENSVASVVVLHAACSPLSRAIATANVHRVIRHVVLLQIDPENPEAVAAIVSALSDLPGAIPEIRRYDVGVDLGLAPTNSTISIVAEFDDLESFAIYRDHPAHTEVIDELILPVLVGRAAAQSEVA